MYFNVDWAIKLGDWLHPEFEGLYELVWNRQRYLSDATAVHVHIPYLQALTYLDR